MALTEKELSEQLLTIKETENPSLKTIQYSQRIQNFAALSNMTELSFEKNGHKYSVYQFVDKGLSKNAKAPVFISIHGGGWIKPHMDNDIYYSALMAHEIHGIVFSPDYTTSDKADWKTMTAQCYDTAVYAAQHAEALGGDPDNIIIGGYSAGGHLTISVVMNALKTSEFHVRKQILCYTPLCFMKNCREEPAHTNRPEPLVRRGIAFENLLTRNEDEFYHNSSVNPWIMTDTEIQKLPETLMITADLCPFHGEDEQFAQRLIANGVTTTSKRYLNTHHGFIPHFYDDWEDAVHLITKFITK